MFYLALVAGVVVYVSFMSAGVYLAFRLTDWEAVRGKGEIIGVLLPIAVASGFIAVGAFGSIVVYELMIGSPVLLMSGIFTTL